MIHHIILAVIMMCSGGQHDSSQFSYGNHDSLCSLVVVSMMSHIQVAVSMMSHIQVAVSMMSYIQVAVSMMRHNPVAVGMMSHILWRLA